MNKSDMVAHLSRTADISPARAQKHLDIWLNQMQDALAKGEKILISDFGSFVVSNRKSFVGRNPKTGAPITVPSIRIPVFRVGKKLRDSMNTTP